MRKLSSSKTNFNKRMFPYIWFGFLAIFAGVAVPVAIIRGEPNPILLVPIAILAVFGYFLMRNLVFDLVDEVYLDGNELVVRNRGEECRFSIANIINVNTSEMANPERITLTLSAPCPLGREIVFSPTFRWWPFRPHPLAKELIELAAAARFEAKSAPVTFER